MMKNILYLIIIITLTSCTTKPRKKLSFDELPFDVRNKFHSVYNYKEPPTINGQGDTVTWYSPPFSECYNLNYGCGCEIGSEGGILRNPKFVISSCNKTIKISWEVLQRVFIIKNDNIYFPAAKDGILTTGEARAFNMKIDTVDFYVQKFN